MAGVVINVGNATSLIALEIAGHPPCCLFWRSRARPIKWPLGSCHEAACDGAQLQSRRQYPVRVACRCWEVQNANRRTSIERLDMPASVYPVLQYAFVRTYVSFSEWVSDLGRSEEYQSVSRASEMAHTTTFNAYARSKRQTKIDQSSSSSFRIRDLIIDDEIGL